MVVPMKNGFTLIDVLVVAAIIFILVSLLLNGVCAYNRSHRDDQRRQVPVEKVPCEEPSR